MNKVDMKRGTFNTIKDHQQIEKYMCENTYTIYIKNTDDPNHIPGTTQHNSFKVRLDPIGKEHIKNAKVKVKSLRLPKETTEGANFKGDVFIRSSIGRNTVVNGGLTSGIIGSAYIKEAINNQLFNTKVIETLAGVPNYGTPTASLTRIGANNKGQVPNGGDAAAPNAMVNVGGLANFDAAQQFPLPDVSKDSDQISRAVNKGCVGWCSDIETLCENPFGKEIQFDILSNDISTLQETGLVAGDGTTIVLQVQLLPDNQANDNFTN